MTEEAREVLMNLNYLEAMDKAYGYSRNFPRGWIRPYNALANAGIMTVGELLQIHPSRLLGCKGFGQRSLAMVRAMLQRLNLDFPSYQQQPTRSVINDLQSQEVLVLLARLNIKLSKGEKTIDQLREFLRS